MRFDDAQKRVTLPSAIRDYVSMTRPPNGILMFLAVMVGCYVSSGKLPSGFETLSVLITAYGLNGSSMVLNDVIDKDVDKLNAPYRPIPSGRISTRVATIYAVTLGIAGLLSSIMLGIHEFIVATAFYSLANIYNIWLKPLGLVGNVSVSLTVVAPFIYGSVLSTETVTIQVVTLGLLAFLSNMGREVIKGIVDVTGDEIRRVNSIARSYGPRAASLVAASLILAAVALSPLPAILGFLNINYVIIVAVADAGFFYSVSKIIKRPEAATARKVKRELLLWMGIALLAFLLGS